MNIKVRFLCNSVMTSAAMLVISLGAQAAANKEAIKLCNGYVENSLDKLPQKVTELGIYQSAECVRAGDRVILLNHYQLLLPVTDMPLSMLVEHLHAGWAKDWCTDPKKRDFLNLIDIEYAYKDKDMKLMAHLPIYKEQCK